MTYLYRVKTYMIIEHFQPGRQKEIYDRLAANGRMIPIGLRFVTSWVNRDKGICFQLMETDNETLFEKWISHWDDLMSFEIFPVE